MSGRVVSNSSTGGHNASLLSVPSRIHGGCNTGWVWVWQAWAHGGPCSWVLSVGKEHCEGLTERVAGRGDGAHVHIEGIGRSHTRENSKER